MTKRRKWTDEDNAKIRSFAGTKTAASIAAELGRSTGAVVVQASKLKVSLRTKHRQVWVTFEDEGPLSPSTNKWGRHLDRSWRIRMREVAVVGLDHAEVALAHPTGARTGAVAAPRGKRHR